MLIIRRSNCITQLLVSSHFVDGRPVRRYVEECDKIIIKQEFVH